MAPGGRCLGRGRRAGAGPGAATTRSGAGQLSAGVAPVAWLPRDPATAGGPRAPGERGEKPRRVPGPAVPGARVLPASGVRGWGSSGPVRRPRSAGSASLQPAVLKELPYFPHLRARAGALGATWPGSGWQPSSPPSRPGLPGCADRGRQPPRSPSGLGQHGFR